MNSICLSSLVDVLSSNNKSLISAFSIINGFEIKEHEKSDFCILAKKVIDACSYQQQMGFYVGQKTTSGLCEEFDFLRYSPNSIVNIEVKTEWPSIHSKCMDQLRSHENVLKLLKSKVFCFVYIVKTDELLLFNNDNLEICSFDILADILESEYEDENYIHKIDLSVMLVSPYSDPEKFLAHGYALTQNQSEIKNRIISSKDCYSIIKGRAGTGKSLLLMDVARYYRDSGKQVIVFLCRNFDSKQSLSKTLDIRIEEIKMLDVMISGNAIDKYDILLFDEAQRIRPEQLDKIKMLSLRDWKIVFSLDPMQSLNEQEVKTDISDKICNLSVSNVYELSNRIRANDAIDLFSQRLVHLNCKKWHAVDFSCIHLSFFDDEDNCIDYLTRLHHDKNHIVIEPTPYTTKLTRTEKRQKHFEYSKDPHSVLGEEFDNVVVLLDEYINYESKDGEILLGSTYTSYYPYDMNHCIYEAVTRAKKTVEVVVLKNIELYVSISEILKYGEH